MILLPKRLHWKLRNIVFSTDSYCVLMGRHRAMSKLFVVFAMDSCYFIGNPQNELIALYAFEWLHSVRSVYQIYTLFSTKQTDSSIFIISRLDNDIICIECQLARHFSRLLYFFHNSIMTSGICAMSTWLIIPEWGQLCD